jgi:putative glutamate/gamma-aminobutyrate antiporter
MSKVVPFPRSISIFTLAMINVAAIGSVKNWPFTAEYGLGSLFFLLLAALVFFFPVSLVAAELATGWPKQGGIYVWVREAFGHRAGFLAIFLLWIENVIWYPTILSFISATLAYIFNPALAENTRYTVTVVLVLFWAATLANLFGMRLSGWISSIGAFCGTMIPGALIIILGAFWYFGGNPIEIPLTAKALIPSFKFNDLVFFTGVLLALAGMEMSSVHARDVKHPQRDYPRAIFLSAALILGLSLLGVLSIAMVIPQKEISLVGGAMQALSVFMGRYNLSSFVPWVAALIAIGAFGSVSTWIIGPSKGLLAAAEGGDLPDVLRKTNEHHAPTALLLIQALIVTVLSMTFVLMPTVSSAFWLLTILVAQLYLVMYILMFAAAIALRYKKPDVQRAYKVPGGKIGIWLVCGIGILGAIFALLIGYIPPEKIEIGSPRFYTIFLLIGTAIGCLLPLLMPHFKRKKT